MIKLVRFSITAIVLATQAVSADTIEQKLINLKFEERQAEVIIQKMLKRGRLSDEEASHARREIASVKEDDVEQIRHEALEDLKNAKSIVNK
ncbi:MAG: hypothetical protein K2Q18_17835 [Bdellovibrionales bacterium]|nr:hypothetical protein [Bdellovibrionales bacterium]